MHNSMVTEPKKTYSIVTVQRGRNPQLGGGGGGKSVSISVRMHV